MKLRGTHLSDIRTPLFKPSENPTKYCKHCKTEKPISDFSRTAVHTCSACKECRRKVDEKRRIEKQSGIIYHF